MIGIVPYPVLPLNTYRMLVGGIAFVILGYKCFKSWSRTKDILMLYFGVSLLPVGVSGLVLALPLFWTRNPSILAPIGLVGFGLVSLTLILHSLVLWQVVFKRIFPYIYIAIPAIIIGTLSWAPYLWHFTVSFSRGLIVWHGAQLAADFYGIMLILLLLPLGYSFLRQGLEVKGTRPKLKSFGIALQYIVVGISEPINAFLHNRVDSVPSSIIGLAAYIIFLIVVLYPAPRKPAIEKQATV